MCQASVESVRGNTGWWDYRAKRGAELELSTETGASSYRDLVARTTPPTRTPMSVEDELDALLSVWQKRERERVATSTSDKPDPIQDLRALARGEFITIFVDLMEKYSEMGISMAMDASNFLEGGREIKFEFGFGEYRMNLHGTVTTEAIAFHETRYAPDVRGELTSGPMLRLRHLDGQAFRDFLCERLAVLLRTVMRHPPPQRPTPDASL